MMNKRNQAYKLLLDLSYDGDSETLWAVEGDAQWVSYEFKEPTRIVSVYVLLNKATERHAYFDIQSSDDGNVIFMRQP